MLVKMFARASGHFTSVGRAATKLEREINAWLEANPGIRVVQMKQSSSGGSFEPSKLWVSIWYEPGT